MIDIQQLLELAKRAALQAGKAILEVYASGDFGVDMKSDNSPLTLADKAAHTIIVLQLQETGLPLLSEEGIHIPYEERKSWDWYWLVDPLDATTVICSFCFSSSIDLSLGVYVSCTCSSFSTL